MSPVDLALFAFVVLSAALAAWVEWKQRSGWAPILLVVAILLAFAAHWLLTHGAFQ